MAEISTYASYRVSSVEELRVLESPVRQEIVDTLSALGPSSIRELATALGLPADGLYYHMGRLLDVGLIVARESVQPRPRDAVVYGLPAGELRLDYGVGPEVRSALGNVVAAALRTATRDFTAALETGAAVLEGPGRNLVGGRKKGWLTPAGVQRMNVLLAEMFDLLEPSGPREGDQLVSLGVVLAPVEARGPRRGDGDPDEF